MLVQTIQSEFTEGTTDIIDTIEKLLEFPIQPVKRTYIQSTFLFDEPPTVISPKLVHKPLNLNTNSGIPKSIARKPKRSKSTQKKLLKKKIQNNDKETDKDKRIKMYLDFITANQKLNGMQVNPYGNTRFLKFCIGKGNNSILSRVALKTRWWWAETKKSNFNFNFIWTQWKSTKVVNHLPKFEEIKDSKA